MSKFTPETIERVREAADIVEIVSAHTDLRRQGERFVGLCPFHDERTPSFSVKPRDGFYYCFGCEAGGDAIRFVQEKDGLSFPDAVEALADRFGVEIERESEDPRAEEARRRRGRLGEALARVSAFYEAFLWESPKAAKARAYLVEERGLGEPVLRAFGVGFAPNGWDSVLIRGQQAGYRTEELLAAGLIQRSQNRPGSHYDRFRGRITFPVRDQRARVVGFGARGMGPDAKPKYLNSPESEMYRKSRTLYGIDRARGPIARGGRAVVVEGYTDVLALHQAGVEEAVAVMGTAITPDQLGLLGGYAEEVVLALDADRAGREAMLRAQRVAGSGKLRLLVAAMPEGEDPAEMMASEEGAGRLREALAGAVELSVFHARAILADADLGTPIGRDRALDEVIPVLNGMGETITRQEMLREVADRLDAQPELIARRIARGGAPSRSQLAQRRVPASDSGDPGPQAPGPQRTPRRDPSPQERREDAMLALCIAAPKAGASYLARLTTEHFTSPATVRALSWLREHLSEPLEGLPSDDDELRGEIFKLKSRADGEPSSAETMELVWLTLERARIERQIAALRREGSDDGARSVELESERAQLADAIASRSR